MLATTPNQRFISTTTRQEIASTGRPTCYFCFRPFSHCLCQDITPFKAHTNILILQHPNERGKYYSTARLLLKSVTNSKLLNGVEFDQSKIINAISKSNPYILYPDITATSCEEIYLNQDSTVIVLDGTWIEARKILKRNPILSNIPKLTFNSTIKSNYLIRKQPKENYLSTIESVGHLLKLNAKSSGQCSKISLYDTLFDTFNQLNQRQVAYFPRMRR